MDGVLVDALPELEGEEGVLAPGDGLDHVDLVLGLVIRQVGIPLSPDGPDMSKFALMRKCV